MIRLLACVPRTTWERWLQEVIASNVAVDSVAPEELSDALGRHRYAGAVLLLCPRVLARWSAVRSCLIAPPTPVVVLTALAVEPLHLLAFERELRVVGLHVIGVEDHPPAMRRSLDRLLTDGLLQRLLQHFGPAAPALEALIAPVWEALASTRSLEAWAELIGLDGERLGRKLRGFGVRNPRRLLTWLRLLAAWPRLHAGAAASVVAMEVGYSAPPALSRSARQFLGFPPSAAPTLPVDALISRAAADLVA